MYSYYISVFGIIWFTVFGILMGLKKKQQQNIFTQITIYYRHVSVVFAVFRLYTFFFEHRVRAIITVAPIAAVFFRSAVLGRFSSAHRFRTKRETI